MTKPTTLHRFILVDQNHAKKEECTAHGLAGARKAFEALRQAKGLRRPAIPTSWTIVDRGPVKAKPEAHSTVTACPSCGESSRDGGGRIIHLVACPMGLALAAPTPEPRAFRVGDRVRIVYTEEGVFKVGDEAKIVAPCAKGTHGCWMAEFDGGHTWHIQPGFSEAELLTTAPQPKAEDPGHVQFIESELEAARAEIASLSSEVTSLKADLEEVRRNSRGMLDSFCDALDMPGEFWGELVAAAKFNKAQVKTLKAEVERLKAELETERNSVCGGTCYEAVKAEAKLDDIKAINRVAEIVNARPDDAEPWHWQGLVQSILDGAA